MKPILLWSDGLVFLLVIALVLFFYKLREDPQTRSRWTQVFSSKLGMVAFTVIITYVGIALLDSLHFRRALDAPRYSPLAQRAARPEKETAGRDRHRPEHR